MSRVAIYHRIFESEGFDKSAQILVELIKTAQKREPDKMRCLFLDIDGHLDAAGNFDRAMTKLQGDFILGHLHAFLSEIDMPLVHAEAPANRPQRNDVDKLEIPPEMRSAVHRWRESKRKRRPTKR